MVWPSMRRQYGIGVSLTIMEIGKRNQLPCCSFFGVSCSFSEYALGNGHLKGQGLSLKKGLFRQYSRQ